MIESLKHQQPSKKKGNLKKKLKARAEAKGSNGVTEKRRSAKPAKSGTQRHPFWALLLLGISVLSALALVSESGLGWTGPMGHKVALAVLRPMGLLAFCIPAALGLAAAMLLAMVRPSYLLLKRSLAALGAVITALAFTQIVAPWLSLYGYSVAGKLIAVGVAPIEKALSTVGSAVLTFGVAFACASSASGHVLARGLVAFLRFVGRTLRSAASVSYAWAASVAHAAVEEHRSARDEADFESDPLDSEYLDAAVAEEAAKRQKIVERKASKDADEEDALDETDDDEKEADEPTPPPDILTIGEDGRIRLGTQKPPSRDLAPIAVEALADAEDAEAEPIPMLRQEDDELEPAPPPQIVESDEPAPRKKKRGAFALQRSGVGAFKLPTVDLLERTIDIHQDIDRNALTETAQRLTQKLADFGIKGRVETIRPGPVITMYEFVPAPGIRVSKIASLADDLAMAMEALQVRIVAPIPGKSVVGIEVPNRQRQKVQLREILEDEGFAKMTSPLTLAFGKDTEGVPYVGDLTRMPHLLVAGTTGSGKSVSMNSMIMSLLFKASPEDVRMIMIDPKMVELSMYEGIPHLLLPVVQDAQKAPLALRWAVDEMERRYQLIGKLKVKDLRAYNDKVARLKKGEKLEDVPVEPPKKVLVVDVANGETEEEVLARMAQGGEAPAEAAPTPVGALDVDELEKLPYIVIIIDELADLMMVASRDVEQSIARLAAKARAAGIHLVIATQRPSTDVISGVIKSNLPVRIAFRLASRHDSATIINQPGAERLLGEGDMLHVPPGCSDPLRLHGAWVRESEIERVVDFWKAQGKPVYDEEILKQRTSEGGEPGEEAVPDELYDQAIAVVAQLERVSISLLQRKMAVGYNRAADLIERMEREGVIGPANGIKPREVLIKPVGEARL